MHPRNIDPALLQRRLDQISSGLKEGVRREVQRLRRLGLPIYVGSNGKVAAMPANPPTLRNGS
jgi:hypothetical protein